MNSIDDFTIAMNMYTYANRPVSRGQYTSTFLMMSIEFIEKKFHSKEMKENVTSKTL